MFKIKALKVFKKGLPALMSSIFEAGFKEMPPVSKVTPFPKKNENDSIEKSRKSLND